MLTPIFFIIGIGLYTAYYNTFEKRGSESIRGLVFFFGMIMLIEVIITLTFGVDYRMAQSAWTKKTFTIGFIGISLRLLVPFIISILLLGFLQLFFSKTYMGMISRGVAQDSIAVRLMGANPIRIKRISFAIAVATSGIVGALFLIIMPLEPTLGTNFISRVFPIVVLAGLGSIRGTLIAGIIIGVAENLTSTLVGPSWSLAVSFGILLLVLTLKPSGLFRR
jgi:branched-chain amino acid transport system permease protein